MALDAKKLVLESGVLKINVDIFLVIRILKKLLSKQTILPRSDSQKLHECPRYYNLRCSGEFDLFYKKEGGYLKDCSCCTLDIQSSIYYINKNTKTEV